MANIRLNLNEPICDGYATTFEAPCDCTDITGLIVYYPVLVDGVISTESKTFTFKDAHNNTMTGVGNLFLQGAIVKVILNVTDGYAYIQNADTNGYIEAFMNHHRATPFSITLASTGWTGSAAPYSQTVSASGLKADNNYMLVSMLADGSAEATQKAYVKAFGIVSSGTAVVSNNSVTFKVYKKPEVGITVGLKGV